MQLGEIDEGVITGLEGAADWVADAQAGLIEPVMLVEQLPRVIEHLTVYLEHDAAKGHPSRQRWLDALTEASEL